jgi:hypothetical protein
MSSGGVNDGDLPELLVHLVSVVMHVDGPCLRSSHMLVNRFDNLRLRRPRLLDTNELPSYAIILSLAIMLGLHETQRAQSPSPADRQLLSAVSRVADSRRTCALHSQTKHVSSSRETSCDVSGGLNGTVVSVYLDCGPAR